MTDTPDQQDVLKKKGGVTSTPDRGLQIWDDQAAPDDDAGAVGGGTAERAAKLSRDQRENAQGDE